MVFSSIHFIFYFLPVFLILYFVVPKQFKNLIIFCASLLFYYYGVKDHPLYLLLLLFSIAINYLIAKKISLSRTFPSRKKWLSIGLLYDFTWLFVFKYLDFFIKNINHLSYMEENELAIPYTHFVLPIGISFYTFQIASYLIDVYRKTVPVEKSMLHLGTYLCMFPQLIAGPIVTYSHIQSELKERTISLKNFENGLKEFTIGMGLKVLIANRIGNLWTQVNAIGFESISSPLAWLGIFAFTFQIYFDFYGYSLMAKGLGLMMGFHFPDNFRNPYLALSMTDFWRRWHITLGSWFREYVYIPLGGKYRHAFLNLFIVWSLTGFWHGANWNFILWGFILFLFIAIEKCGPYKFFKKHPGIGHIYMLFLIPLSWLIFAVTDIKQLIIYFQRLFPFFSPSSDTVFQGDFLKYGKMYIWFFVASVILCTGIPRTIYNKWKNHFIISMLLVAIFWASIYCMILGMEDPFLYFQF